MALSIISRQAGEIGIKYGELMKMQICRCVGYGYVGMGYVKVINIYGYLYIVVVVKFHIYWCIRTLALVFFYHVL